MNIPRRGVFLSATWQYLVMLNFEVPAEILLPLVPAGTQLDLWQGRAIASVVGFRFLRARVLHVGVPWHGNFDEVNLRFYVSRTTSAGDIRRGVAFVKELVPRKAIAWVARWAYNEPYEVRRMKSEAPTVASECPGRIAYSWHDQGAWPTVAATAVGSPFVPLEDSEAGFIVNHLWGYTRQRNGSTIEYEVEHPPWRVWNVDSPELTANGSTCFGADFSNSLAAKPISALIAEGSAVRVYRPARLPSLAVPRSPTSA